IISVPTVIFRPDWVTRRSSGPDTPCARDNISCTARTPLRRSAGRSSCADLTTPALRVLRRRPSSCARSNDSARTTSAKYAPTTIARTTTNVSATIAIYLPALLNDLDVLEEIRRQVHARRGEAVCALGPDLRCSEPPTHLAVGTEAGTLEQEDVLHRDDVPFHA